MCCKLICESGWLHKKCDDGEKGLQERIESLVSDRSFVLKGARRWHNPHALGARALANYCCYRHACEAAGQTKGSSIAG